MPNSNVGGRRPLDLDDMREELQEKGLQFGEVIVNFFRFISSALKYLLFSIIILIKTLFEKSMLNGFVGLFSLMIVILASDNYYRAITGLSLAPFYVDSWVGWSYWIPEFFYFLPIKFQCVIDPYFWISVIFMLTINSVQAIVIRMWQDKELQAMPKGQALFYIALAGLMYVIEISYTLAGRVSYESGDLLDFGFGAHAVIMFILTVILVIAPEFIFKLTLRSGSSMMQSR